MALKSIGIPVQPGGIKSDWRVDYPIEIRDVDEPDSLTLYDGTPLEYAYSGRKLTFQIPWKYKHNYTDPVRLRFK